MIQSLSTQGCYRTALQSQRCQSSRSANNTAVGLDDRVVSAVIRSVPPRERALSVPDHHESYVNVAVSVDDTGGGRSRAGHGSLKVTRRSDRAQAYRDTAEAVVLPVDSAVEKMEVVAVGTAKTRRRARLQQSFGSIHRADSSTSINLSRKSYERLTGLELPPTPTPPSPNDVPVIPTTPIIVTVVTTSTSTSPRPPCSMSATRNCIRPWQPSHLPSPLPTIKMDENNVPQIDVAITPTSEYFDDAQTSMFKLGAPPPPRQRRSGSPTCRLRRPLSGVCMLSPPNSEASERICECLLVTL